MPTAAYDPSDTAQSRFLSALAKAEGGTSASIGYGGADLSNAPTDQYGFPQWNGVQTSYGPTHAAGYYQFQPGTWDGIAEQYHLNFANPADQHAGAWYLAQDVYARKTGGRSLEDAINAGDYNSITSALGSTWQSLQLTPKKFTDALANGTGADLPGGATQTSANPQSQFSPYNPSTWLPAVEDWFIRGGLIIIGGLIVIVALYILMEKQGLAPSPGEVAKAVAA